jgi:hypothetical protein
MSTQKLVTDFFTGRVHANSFIDEETAVALSPISTTEEYQLPRAVTSDEKQASKSQEALAQVDTTKAVTRSVE